MIAIAMQATPAATGNPMGSLFIFVPFILIFYFLLFRPQQKRLKQHQTMLSEIVRGNTVVTNGGLIGKVTKVDDNELTVQIAEGLKVKVVKTMIADVRNRNVAANDSSKGKKA